MFINKLKKQCQFCKRVFLMSKKLTYKEREKRRYCSIVCKNKYPITENVREKLRLTHIGKKPSQETKNKMKLSSTRYWLGKKRPDISVKSKNVIEERYKNGEVFGFKKAWKDNPDLCRGDKSFFYGKHLIGINNPNWIKDRSKLKKRDKRNDSAYREWRVTILKRDNYKCRINNIDCCGRLLEIHHILGWSEYPELRYQVNNGITLCHAHHPKKRAEEKRLVPTFKELVSVLSA